MIGHSLTIKPYFIYIENNQQQYPFITHNRQFLFSRQFSDLISISYSVMLLAALAMECKPSTHHLQRPGFVVLIYTKDSMIYWPEDSKIVKYTSINLAENLIQIIRSAWRKSILTADKIASISIIWCCSIRRITILKGRFKKWGHHSIYTCLEKDELVKIRWSVK